MRKLLVVLAFLFPATILAQRSTPTTCVTQRLARPDSALVRTCRDTLFGLFRVDTVRIIVKDSTTPPVVIPPPVDTTPPIPPPSGGGIPAGYTVIFDGSPKSWPRAGNQNNIATRGDTLQIKYPLGCCGGNAPANAYYPLGSNTKDSLYVRWVLRLSPNFQPHPENINKLAFVYQGDADKPVVFIQAYGNNLNATLNFQDLCPPDSRSFTSSPAVSLKGGAWYTIEVLVTRVGRAVMWVNGTKVVDRAGIPLCAGKFRGVNLDPTYGGTGGSVSVSNMFIEYSRVTIAGK